VNFNIQFISPYNSLSSYGYNVSYPSSSFANSSTNGVGYSFNNYFNLNSATFNSYVTIFYWYNLTNGVYYNQTLSYPIVYVYSNRTWANTGNAVNVTTGQDATTGYYVGERVLIVTLIAVVMFGVGWVIGGGITGLVFSMIPILFFINSGFVPKELYYVFFVFLVIYIVSRGSDT
jgi:hypothetical protein